MQRRYLVAISAVVTLTFALPASAVLRHKYSFDGYAVHLGDARQLASWGDMLDRHAVQMSDTLEPCIDAPDTCSGRQKALGRLIERAAGMPLRKQLQVVNGYINHRRYNRDESEIEQRDDAHYKFRNHWATLNEFLTVGGDCEDYATAKYLILRRLGIAPERMRVVVAWDRSERGYHALLAVRRDDGSVAMLDTDNTITASTHRGLRYIYAINEQSIWDHRPPSRVKPPKPVRAPR